VNKGSVAVREAPGTWGWLQHSPEQSKLCLGAFQGAQLLGDQAGGPHGSSAGGLGGTPAQAVAGELAGMSSPSVPLCCPALLAMGWGLQGPLWFPAA